ncbi:hypothetical protein V2J09_000965 [Rumex salicifolius]
MSERHHLVASESAVSFYTFAQCGGDFSVPQTLLGLSHAVNESLPVPRGQLRIWLRGALLKMARPRVQLFLVGMRVSGDPRQGPAGLSESDKRPITADFVDQEALRFKPEGLSFQLTVDLQRKYVEIRNEKEELVDLQRKYI